MLNAFLHHDTLFAEMVEPLLSHVWSQAEVDANVVFQFHISCCLMVRCFLYSLSSMKDDANIYNNVITCIFWCKQLGRANALNFLPFNIYMFKPYLIDY